MAKRCPHAIWDPLGNQTEPRMTSHDIICIHTMVGTLEGVDALFERDGYTGVESHFGTGGAGEARQWQDLAFQADANLHGGHRVISIENEDKGPGFPTWTGTDVPEFTDEQMDKLVEIVAWLCSKEAHADCPSGWECRKSGIPPKVIPDTKPGQRGIGWHRLGIEGNYPPPPLHGLVPGGEVWSELDGKACPGVRRIHQTIDELVPRVQELLNPPKDHDYRVVCRKDGKEQTRTFERARKDTRIDEYILRKVRNGWTVRIKKVNDIDRVKT